MKSAMTEPRSGGGRADRAWLLSELPVLSPEALHECVLTDARAGGRLVGLWAWPVTGGVELFSVVAFDADGRLSIYRATAGDGATFPSLTPALPAAQAFEREIFELLGLRPVGHPWLKPLLRHADLARAGDAAVDAHPFFRVDGPGIHEVAVGPVHAGVIEPGHFRFQCAGETVLYLEIQLGYQHRSAEALMLASTPARRLVIAESIAGDTVIGHATAFCDVIQTLAGT